MTGCKLLTTLSRGGEAPDAVWTQVFWLQDSDSWLLN
jgi:hypothetical protein